MGTALVKFDPQTLAKPLNTVDDFARFCLEHRHDAFILAPVTKLDYMPEIFQISRRMVLIDPTVPGPNESGPECYHSGLFHKGNPNSPDGEVSLGRTALLKILGAAGASPVETIRTDGEKDPHRCAFRVVCAMQDFDGAWRQMPGTAELDLRDGSEDAKKMKPGQLANARRKIVRLTESMAMNAATRALLGIPHKFKVGDLRSKPFIVPKLILRDGHPAVQQELIKNSMGTVRMLYGPGAADETRTVKDVTPAPVATEPAAAAMTLAKPAPSTQAQREPGEDDEGDDFAPLDLAPPALILCLCPCSCQKELTPEVAEQTTKAYGAHRCGACFPGKKFNYDQHKGLRNLGLPGKHAHITADDVRNALQKAK